MKDDCCELTVGVGFGAGRNVLEVAVGVFIGRAIYEAGRKIG